MNDAAYSGYLTYRRRHVNWEFPCGRCTGKSALVVCQRHGSDWVGVCTSPPTISSSLSSNAPKLEATRDLWSRVANGFNLRYESSDWASGHVGERNTVYLSNSPTILLDERTKSQRTEILSRLYGMDFNLIPMNGKKPCVEWKPYQTQRVTPEEIKEWMRGRFPTKNGKNTWKAENHNFALLTGAIPWSGDNPGIVVIDSDDEEAEALVQRHCPSTPAIQRTGSGGLHRVYRRPPVEEAAYIANRQKTIIDGRQYDLDVRADGGYIMAPGSVHPKTGKLYREETPWTLELLEQCPVYDPSWLPCERASTAKRPRSSAAMPREIDDFDHNDRIADVDVPVAERERQAKVYLEHVPGTQEGTGADRSCTSLTMRLLYGFALPAGTALEMLAEWGQRADQLDTVGGWYPWTEEELARKIEWCLGQEYGGEVGGKLHAIRDLGQMEAKVDEIVEPFDVATTAKSKNSVVIDPKDQLATATKFFGSKFGGKTLVHHQGCWYHWTGRCYELVSDDDIKARLWKWLGKCSCWTKLAKTDSAKLKPYQPSRSFVAGIMDALKAVTNQTSNIQVPCWLSSESSNPNAVIAFDNGLLDVEGFLAGSATLLDHTPNWFSTNCLPHQFDQKATCPRWLEFLDQVFDGDEERIRTLQQWFGYNLIADNRQHKLALMIGPPRSGKGTTMAVMSEMLGKHNVASSSLASLGGRFGLEPLVGKLAALIDEGHLGKFSDTSSVLERLKAISGGSEQTVDRKGLPAMSSVALKVRFTIAVNELPRLSDSSAAMRSRLLVVPYFNSYEGKENFGLLDRLLTEIPGVTNWALEGLRLLRTVGRFTNPAAGEKILRDFVYLSSPIQAFLDECCEVGEDKQVRRNDLQLAWHRWCNDNGHIPGSIADFGKKLRAAIPRIDDERRRVDGHRERWHIGVSLTSEAHADIARARNGA
jgi:P4 family phage/plasmid primase-like protien